MRAVSFLLLAFFIQNTFAQGFKGDTWSQALRDKKAKVVLTNAHLPKFSENINGQGKGICFDIMDDFADYVKSKYGVVITYQYSPVAEPENFQLFLDAVRSSSGGVFGLGDITITDKRKTIYEFTPPYFSNVAILITNKSVPDLKDISQLPTAFSGMKAISQPGTSHDVRLKSLAKKYGDFEIVYSESSANKIEKVLKEPGYFTYIDFPNYLELIASGAPMKRHPVGDNKGESFGFIMPKGSDWSPIIAEFFNAKGGYLKSEAYEKILRDNLSEKIVSLIKVLQF